MTAAAGLGLMPIPRPANMHSMLRKYGSSAWVYICVQKQARDLSSPPLIVANSNSEGDLDLVDRAHPLAAILRKPNPWTTGGELVAITSMYLNLTGNAFWLVGARDRRGFPAQLYPVNPVAVEIYTSGVSMIDRYRIWHYGEPVDVPPQDLLHFRLPNPLSDADSMFPNPWGVGPLEAGWDLIVTDQDAVRWNRSLVANDGRPTGMLKSDQAIGPVDAQFAAEQYRKVFGGPDKQGRVLVLGKNLEYQRLAITPVEMDYHDTSLRLREEIMSVFGMNPTVLGLLLGDVSGRKEQHEEYWNATVISMAKSYLLPPINERLAPQFGPDLIVAQDYTDVPALQANESERSQYVYRYWQMGFPADELNDRYDLGFTDQPDGAGKVGFISVGTVPIEQALEPPEPPPAFGGGGPPAALPAPGDGNADEEVETALALGAAVDRGIYVQRLLAAKRIGPVVPVRKTRTRRVSRLLVTGRDRW